LNTSQENINNASDVNNNSSNLLTESSEVSEVRYSAAEYFIPLILSILLFFGFAQIDTISLSIKNYFASEENNRDKNKHNISLSALLAAEEFSKNLKDTIYTNDKLWLEFRIDQQMLYVHFRDGRLIKYPVSSGIPGAHKSVDSRPGLFAIFYKADVHKSSQFNSQLNYFMAFNMGIGFHGLQGTGYYSHLGIRPSSHGCVRMRNEDVRELFKHCSIGTLVLAHKGNTNRIIAFAPEGFENEVELTKEDHLSLLAYNLASIMEGKYFINPPKRFILDGTVIPKSGINILSNVKIPEKQFLPQGVVTIKFENDIITNPDITSISELSTADFIADKLGIKVNDSLPSSNLQIAVAPELIKKYVHNPLGILPYFPPDR
jgi:hypothetical protein